MKGLSLHRLSALVGPLLTKELLVTSRRGKYYMLRFGYAAVLGLVVSLVWLASLEAHRGSDAGSIARMSEMGKSVIRLIMCFQFGAAQFVAVVLLSSAVNEEIYQRTLVPILTTPVSFWQIILGKFLGKLLHVGILLAISLPLLGVVRVLGGVPWGYLLSGLCITITASMFTGSVALMFSVVNRRPSLAILASLGVIAVLYMVVGLVLLLLSAIASSAFGMVGWNVVLCGNPVAAMVYETIHLTNPSVVVPYFFWPVHCAVMLVLTFCVLCLAQDFAGRTALKKAVHVGGAITPEPMSATAAVTGRLLPALMPGGHAVEDPEQSDPPWAPPRRRLLKARGWNIHRLIGTSPIVWRELRKPLLRDKIVQIVTMSAVVFYLLYSYAILGASQAMGEPATQSFFVGMFLIVGLACTALDSATSIAPEKKARTWAALLCTPVSDWHILLGKAGGTAFRCLAVWVFLALHVLLFTLTGHLHPIAIVHVGLIALGSNLFLTCSGVYFSARYRNVATALLMNMGMVGMLWLLIPLGARQIGVIFDIPGTAGLIQEASPLTQAWTTTAGATRVVDWNRAADGSMMYDWPMRRCDALTTTGIVLTYTLIYGAVALLLAWRAKVLLRKNVFER